MTNKEKCKEVLVVKLSLAAEAGNKNSEMSGKNVWIFDGYSGSEYSETNPQKNKYSEEGDGSMNQLGGWFEKKGNMFPFKAN